MSRDEESNVVQPAPVDWWNLEEVLAYFVHNASLILDEFGAELTGFQLKRESIVDLSDTDKDRAIAAAQVLSRADLVWSWVEKNDCRNAALNMMQLTRAAVELMPMKGLAVSAERSRQGLDAGRAKLQEHRRHKRDLCREIARDIRSRDSSLSATSTAKHTSRRLAEEHGIPLGERQVYNYICDLWQDE